MGIEFCPKCKELLQIKTENGKNIGICKCGFKASEIDLVSKEIKRDFIVKGEGIVSDKNEIEGITHLCKKCGHDKAEVIDVGVYVSDEAGIYLFKCLKCGYSFRQADGSCNM
jgi:DNA-directed RNA polymerase subunit M/transcription elongation factor TFIIS